MFTLGYYAEKMVLCILGRACYFIAGVEEEGFDFKEKIVVLQ